MLEELDRQRHPHDGVNCPEDQTEGATPGLVEELEPALDDDARRRTRHRAEGGAAAEAERRVVAVLRAATSAAPSSRCFLLVHG